MQLELDGIGKRYGDEHALRDVDLVLEPGVVGLLGPNGAGKSTLMRIVTTVLQPTDGRVRWNGTDVREEPRAIRDSVGYLPQSFGVYPSLTAREFLRYLAAIRGVSNVGERIDDLLALVNLEAAADRRLGGFSGGMRQRVGIAQALLADPELLVVDEPTVGLDPTERVRFRNVLAELAEDRIVVLSTHIVSDVEVTASDIVLLHDGRVLAHESPAALLDEVEGSVWEWTVGDDDLAEVKREYTISGTARRSDGVAVRVVSASRPTPAAEPAEPTLEDAYLDAIGR
ncbi:MULTISPECIES: ABC transporter ATP-binding protein [Halomicrobium]|uniref:ABC transporter related n=2 Tax=Halomicrobium mukohataei TaxID=57705 RepID=C7NYU0_HALMD|nr:MULTISPECIES: ABC transporter ATP-binding protein [Halomicrobium]ACV48629.1 ABC transporter related [Halomicrobium mukohataei DSM 12286]QCD67027.1 ABC transporter ATP-binding protein [Halomicrobium mukohataei]QFR21837.1 ATP-binding cassette domain-containing protein [Halomicrobium sp. ZPS1]